MIEGVILFFGVHLRQVALRITSQQQQKDILFVSLTDIHFGQLALQISSQQQQNTFPSTADIFVYSLRTVSLTDKQSTAAE